MEQDGPAEAGPYDGNGPREGGPFDGPAKAGPYDRPAKAGPYVRYALKQDLSRTRTTITDTKLDDEDTFSRIRCPLCAWQPSPVDRWSCVWTDGSPEPRFASCGAIWNTFETRGRCPGCLHQWRWTSCLRCAGWSPHDDWYEDAPA